MSSRSSLPTRRRLLHLAAMGTAALLATFRTRLFAEQAAELMPQDEGKQGPPVVTALAVDPVRGLVAMGGDDHRIRVTELASRRQLHLLSGHTDWVRSLAFGRDGKTLFSAGNDGKLLAWSETDPKSKQIVRHSLPFTSLAVSPMADMLAATTWDGEVHLYDAASMKQLKKIAGPGNDTLAVAFSPDGHLLAAAGRGRVMVWNAATGDVVADERPHRQRVRALAFSPDGKFLASAGDDRSVHFRPLGSEQVGTTLPLEGCKVFALLFVSPEEIATAGSDGTVRVWNVVRKEEVRDFRAHTGTVAALAWHDGRLLSAGFDAAVKVWSLEDRVAEVPPSNDAR
jgi:WD40 repeat protein